MLFRRIIKKVLPDAFKRVFPADDTGLVKIVCNPLRRKSVLSHSQGTHVLTAVLDDKLSRHLIHDERRLAVASKVFAVPQKQPARRIILEYLERADVIGIVLVLAPRSDPCAPNLRQHDRLRGSPPAAYGAGSDQYVKHSFGRYRERLF